MAAFAEPGWGEQLLHLGATNHDGPPYEGGPSWYLHLYGVVCECAA